MLSTLILASLLAPPKEILLVLNKAEDTVSLHDTETNEVIKTIPTGHGPNEVMVSPGGTWATISNMGSGQKRDRTITVLSMPSGDIARTISFPEHQRPHGMAWEDKNRFVVTTHEPEALHMVDASNGKIEFTIPCPSRGLHMVVLSPDKKMAYGACAFGNQMAAFDLEKKELVKRVDCGARAEGIAIFGMAGIAGNGTVPATAPDFGTGVFPTGSVGFSPGQTTRTVTIASRNVRAPRFSVYHDGRGSDPVMVVGSTMSWVARYMRDSPSFR